MSTATWRMASLVILSVALLLACASKGKAQENVKESRGEPQKQAVAKAEAAGRAPDPAWHMARINRARVSRTSVKGPRSPRLKWVFRTDGRVYGDAAMAEDGTLYVPSHDGHLYAVDRDGRELWAFDAGGKIWSSPAIATDGTIYFGSDGDKLFALSPKGEPRWILSTEVPPKNKKEKPLASRWDVDTSPAIGADGTVYFGCHYYLYAVRPSGEVRWRFQAGVDRVKIFSSPAIGPRGTIFFGTQGKRLFALDQNANVLWNVTTGGDNDSTPAVGDGGAVYFGSDDGLVRALDITSGEMRWEAALGAPVRAPLAIGHDGTVFAATYGTKPFVVALDGTNGQERWRFHTEEGEGAFYGIQSGVLVDGEGYLYFGGRDHYVYCLTPEGERLWRYETGDQVDANPILGPDGTLYIGSDDRRLYAFER
jgi:outer membrane protein assembly factor BamB